MFNGCCDVILFDTLSCIYDADFFFRFIGLFRQPPASHSSIYNGGDETSALYLAGFTLVFKAYMFLCLNFNFLFFCICNTACVLLFRGCMNVYMSLVIFFVYSSAVLTLYCDFFYFQPSTTQGDCRCAVRLSQ